MRKILWLFMIFFNLITKAIKHKATCCFHFFLSDKFINLESIVTFRGLTIVSSSVPWNFISFWLLNFILYGTFGDVMITSWLNSFSSLSLKTSICSKPKNPSLYPWPNAGEESSDTETLESLMHNLSIDCLKRLKVDESSGKNPEKTYSTWKLLSLLLFF